jgi:Zn-dependent membrane protease YugP
VQLLNLGIVQPQESPAISKVLSAAAMTYVAGLIAAIGQLLYFLSLARGHRN